MKQATGFLTTSEVVAVRLGFTPGHSTATRFGVLPRWASTPMGNKYYKSSRVNREEAWIEKKS